MRKLAKVFDSSSIVSSGGRLFVGKQAKKDWLTIDSYVCSPFVVPLVKVDSPEPALVIFALPVISRLSGIVNYAQILIGVIQRIAVDVVAFAWIVFVQSENNSMHEDSVPRCAIGNATISAGVEALQVLVPPREPFELTQFFVAMRRYFRDFSLSKVDFAVGWFRGLGRLLFQVHVVPLQRRYSSAL